jgi:hypothetical protein
MDEDAAPLPRWDSVLDDNKATAATETLAES